MWETAPLFQHFLVLLVKIWEMINQFLIKSESLIQHICVSERLLQNIMLNIILFAQLFGKKMILIKLM